MQTDVIYVQKRKNRFWVWMGNDADTDPRPAKCDVKFYGCADALNYALNWRNSAKSVCVVRQLSDLTL